MKTLVLAATFALSVPAAFAHVTLETGMAAQKASYKAVLRVPHGCNGEATNAVRIRIPEGVIAVKPMPKPGWTIEITTAPYARPYEYFGSPMTEGVTELAWTGGDLPDAWYDEFTFRAFLTDALPVGSTLYFPVVQECATLSERWIEIPAEGQDGDALERPAPGLKIGEPGAGH
jgi:periplasmic copper chaperone A